MELAATQEPIGVALLNMGGPATVEEIRPFLTRLFSDAVMLPLPAPLRQLLARLIAWRRSPKVAGRYEAIGGGSPVGPESARQAHALQQRLGRGFAVRHVFRYSEPGPGMVLDKLYLLGVRRLVALPAYPQWSETTSGSSVAHLGRVARHLGLECLESPPYPAGEGFVRSLAAGIGPLLDGADHLLFTAHGLPARVVRRGDPYVAQVQRTVAALERLLPADPPRSLAFQSRLGPLAWVGPHVDDEIRRLAGAGVRRLVLAPITFVCENLETLWDLDREMAGLADRCGIEDYRRAPVPGTDPAFIGELARLVRGKARQAGWIADGRPTEIFDES
jgi:ferrochelatase